MTVIPGVCPESLRAVMAHLSGAWARRTEPNVLLVHYDDLCADLEGQMRGIAWRLGIAVPERAWPALTQAATFEQMRDRSDQLVPSARPAPPPAIHPPAHPAHPPAAPAHFPVTPPRPPADLAHFPAAPPRPPADPARPPADPARPPADPAQPPADPAHFPAAPARHPSARPSEHGIFLDTASFFRRGSSGAGREILSDEELARYHARAAQLAPPDMLEWLHSPSR